MSEEQANPSRRRKGSRTAEAEAPEAPVKKEETAEDLLKSDLDGVKIRRAKGSEEHYLRYCQCTRDLQQHQGDLHRCPRQCDLLVQRW